MGCVSQKGKRSNEISINQGSQQQLSDQVRKAIIESQDDQSKVIIYDPTRKKEVLVPRLRSPLYNRIVQQRKLQVYESQQ